MIAREQGVQADANERSVLSRKKERHAIISTLALIEKEFSHQGTSCLS